MIKNEKKQHKFVASMSQLFGCRY